MINTMDKPFNFCIWWSAVYAQSLNKKTIGFVHNTSGNIKWQVMCIREIDEERYAQIE